MQNKNIAIGARITTGNITSTHPDWSLHVKPGQRKSGASGKVLGFFRLDDDLLAVTHDDGSQGVYEASEVTALN